jgi:hypothetical protein
MQPVFALDACRENINRLLQKDRLFQGRFPVRTAHFRNLSPKCIEYVEFYVILPTASATSHTWSDANNSWRGNFESSCGLASR